MTLNSNSFEEETGKLLKEAKYKLEKISKEIADLNNKAKVFEEQVNAYETALQVYRKSTGTHVNEEPDWISILKNGNTHKDRIKLIAKQKGGRIKVSEVTDILYSTRLINTKKRVNAYSIVQISLAGMVKKGEIEKIGQGEYRLVGAQQSLIQ